MSRVVLLGDGVPNDATLIPGIARRVAGLGATITSLGLGLEFDETLMTQVAQLSGGRFHFIDDAARVSAVFEKEVTQVKRVASRMVTVDFSPGPGVKILEVLGAGAGGFATTRVNVADVIASLAPRPAPFDPAMGTVLGGGTGLGLHPTKPSAAPAALSADEALFVKRTHGAARGALQGDR